MKAVRFHQQGPPDVLRYEEAPAPSPGPDQVLVRVRACSVNHIDIWTRTTTPGLSFPHIPGSDAAGEIVAVGSAVASHRTGDRVAITPGLFDGTCEHCLAGEQSICDHFGIIGRDTDGAYAELLAAPAVNAHPLPERLSFETAAALSLSSLTAWHMLITRARLRAGETVLIVGASGGLGTAAVQIAKLAGATVIATAATQEKRDRLRALGADLVIDYQAGNIDAQVRDFTRGRGADVAFEHVGPATFEQSLRSLVAGGRLVICGATTGPTAAFEIRPFYSRQLSITGCMLGTPNEFRHVLPLAAEGLLMPVIQEVLPLAAAAEAHRRLEAGEVFGKIVLAP